jgi:hypothetical protein
MSGDSLRQITYPLMAPGTALAAVEALRGVEDVAA